MKIIQPEDLVCMDALAAQVPLRVDLAYARADNFLFGERLYRTDAQLYLHSFLADVVVHAAELAFQRHGLTLVLYDGLRTVEAQQRMLETRRVKENPHWVENIPRLLSRPGEGGHPRGMAVDVSLLDTYGQALDMGTVFDFLAENPDAAHNPAHRDHPQTEAVQTHRDILDRVMLEGAKKAGRVLFPLPQEWWDYRLPTEFFSQYAPLSEANLPPDLRLL
ncbi:MAG: D-alanyl-D-alanine carboxypeptidase family protein [Alphaproteobacteria bacterium]|nr:D-alanyl-D-alanine carboxypeptidase family protein [Alphaproteobacteria bacterium]MBP7758540.1 D-alanyl-D-alanine carboxypeptidase family protein [Alphaproteobacteria bacterium]MBP7761973.1 D-alanyl-D-alanine carboxypeptidase family protein [Alphaproteobacteria bacterium]MBP7905535.1 D-alanyl-D-alanine carboxypeptidase family protein [Alphaproteobacteria bacterium]